MSESSRTQPGTICWHDLTVPDAEGLRDFYSSVVGWESQGVSMGDYEDFSMVVPATGEGVAGVCHARGANAGLPAQWLMYVAVEDVEASAARCRELGGEILVGPRSAGGGTFCVIRDPAGAAFALHASPPPTVECDETG
jgi:predicted enzyme related to lactoylglutathione lyase